MAVKQIKAWKTSDGKVFEDPDSAAEHDVGEQQREAISELLAAHFEEEEWEGDKWDEIIDFLMHPNVGRELLRLYQRRFASSTLLPKK